MPAGEFLAIAFTDMNGNHKFNPGKDTLIAALVDTNKDNAVSVGDTVQWGTYPAIPDESASGIGGTYTSPDSTVTGVAAVGITFVEVATALGPIFGGFDFGTILWRADPNLEQFLSAFPSGVRESHMFDSITETGSEDLIDVEANTFGPGQPSMSVDHVSTPQLGDQAFLDVFLDWLV
jgi:hypothetical protein